MTTVDLANLIGATINLETYAPEILGTGYKRVKILSILDHQDATRYSKVGTLHSTVLANLPRGTTADYTKLSYLKVKLNNGEVRALAIAWIRPESILSVDEYRRVRIVLDKVSVEEEDNLRRLLIGNSYTILQMEEDK